MAAEPIVHGLEEELKGELIVLRADLTTPAGQQLAGEYNSRVTPTFILLDGNGLELWRQFGSLDAARVHASLTHP